MTDKTTAQRYNIVTILTHRHQGFAMFTKFPITQSFSILSHEVSQRVLNKRNPIYKASDAVAPLVWQLSLGYGDHLYHRTNRLSMGLLHRNNIYSYKHSEPTRSCIGYDKPKNMYITQRSIAVRIETT